MNEHTCIKPGCGAKYQDENADAYYCPPCKEIRDQAAKKLDAKFNTVGQQPRQIFEGSREFKTPDGRTINFFKDKQMI